MTKDERKAAAVALAAMVGDGAARVMIARNLVALDDAGRWVVTALGESVATAVERLQRVDKTKKPLAAGEGDEGRSTAAPKQRG